MQFCVGKSEVECTNVQLCVGGILGKILSQQQLELLKLLRNVSTLCLLQFLSFFSKFQT